MFVPEKWAGNLRWDFWIFFLRIFVFLTWTTFHQVVKGWVGVVKHWSSASRAHNIVLTNEAFVSLKSIHLSILIQPSNITRITILQLNGSKRSRKKTLKKFIPFSKLFLLDQDMLKKNIIYLCDACQNEPWALPWKHFLGILEQKCPR